MHENSVLGKKEITDSLFQRLSESTRILPENRQAILDYYHVRIASGSIKPISLYSLFKPLVRLGEYAQKPFKQLSEPELARYFNNLEPEPRYLLINGVKRVEKNVGQYGQYTVWHYKNAVKAFYRWLFEKEINIPRDRYGNPLVVSWIKGSPAKIKSKYQKEALSRDEIKKMLDAAKHPRDKAIIALLFETGIRAGELLGIKKEDIVLNKDWAEITVDGKTGERTVLSIKSYPFLLNWISYLKFLNPNWNGLWITRDGSLKPLQKQGLLVVVKSIAKKAGIAKRVFVHGFRHSSATDKTMQGWNEEELRMQHGWAKGSAMPGTYVHYRKDDFKKKILKNAGIITEENKDLEKEVFEYRECPFCNTKNPKENAVCFHCKKPLKLEIIVEEVNLRAENQKLKEVVTTLNNLTASLNDRVNKLETEKVRTAQSGYH